MHQQSSLSKLSVSWKYTNGVEIWIIMYCQHLPVKITLPGKNYQHNLEKSAYKHASISGLTENISGQHTTYQQSW